MVGNTADNKGAATSRGYLGPVVHARACSPPRRRPRRPARRSRSSPPARRSTASRSACSRSATDDGDARPQGDDAAGARARGADPEPRARPRDRPPRQGEELCPSPLKRPRRPSAAPRRVAALLPHLVGAARSAGLPRPDEYVLPRRPALDRAVVARAQTRPLPRYRLVPLPRAARKTSRRACRRSRRSSSTGCAATCGSGSTVCPGFASSSCSARRRCGTSGGSREREQTARCATCWMRAASRPGGRRRWSRRWPISSARRSSRSTCSPSMSGRRPPRASMRPCSSSRIAACRGRRCNASARRPLDPRAPDGDMVYEGVGALLARYDDAITSRLTARDSGKYDALAQRLADKGFTAAARSEPAARAPPAGHHRAARWVADLRTTAREPYLVEIGADEIPLRVQKNPWWHGGGDWLCGRFTPVVDEFYGRGLPEVFDYLQYFANDLGNQSGDAFVWATNPIAVVDIGAVQDPTSLRMAPGAKWLANPAGVQFTTPPQGAAQAGFEAVSELSLARGHDGGADAGAAARARRSESPKGDLQAAIADSAVDLRAIVESLEDEVMVPLLERSDILSQQCLDRDIVLKVAGADGVDAPRASHLRRRSRRRVRMGMARHDGGAEPAGARAADGAGHCADLADPARSSCRRSPSRSTGPTSCAPFWSVGLGLPDADRVLTKTGPTPASDWRYENALVRVQRAGRDRGLPGRRPHRAHPGAHAAARSSRTRARGPDGPVGAHPDHVGLGHCGRGAGDDRGAQPRWPAPAWDPRGCRRRAGCRASPVDWGHRPGPGGPLGAGPPPGPPPGPPGGAAAAVLGMRPAAPLGQGRVGKTRDLGDLFRRLPRLPKAWPDGLGAVGGGLALQNQWRWDGTIDGGRHGRDVHSGGDQETGALRKSSG